jgi:hypothetical protein
MHTPVNGMLNPALMGSLWGKLRAAGICRQRQDRSDGGDSRIL